MSVGGIVVSDLMDIEVRRDVAVEVIEEAAKLQNKTHRDDAAHFLDLLPLSPLPCAVSEEGCC